MKFVQFYYNNTPNQINTGYMEGYDRVVDMNKCDNSVPPNMLGMLMSGCACGATARINTLKPSLEPLSTVTLLAPITGMDKVLCVGLNYSDYCKEQNKEPPTVPMIFSKFASCIIGQNETVRLRTEVALQVDWEVELVAVIGKTCSNVKASDALKYIFGYTIAQDISSRDWQKNNGGQFLLGKAQDTYCPIGPWIVTADEVGDPHTLDIKCSVNGTEKQRSNTSNLIFKIPEIIERLSSVLTLLPGDIILTGSPGGVGANRSPPEFLKPGDVIRSEVENIGAFEVKVVKF